MNDFRIEELPIPASLEASDATGFIQMTAVRNEVAESIIGSGDLSYQPAERLPEWHDPYQVQHLFVARVDNAIVAAATYSAPLETGSNEAWLEVEVLPDFRRRGIGSALHDRVSALARDADRRVRQLYVVHAFGAGDHMASTTGSGSVPRNSPEVRFLLALGYALEQVERISRLPLPLDPGVLARLHASALTSAGDDYHIHRWAGRTPARWHTDIATLHARMSTDAPAGGLDIAEELWDEERVRTYDDLAESSPRTHLTAAVEHAPTGRLVAFSTLSVPLETDRPADQEDTLVLAEHRGHRLGMLVKAANLAFLAEEHPGRPGVITFNAEENRYMLALNEALGFLPVGYGGGWRITL